MQANFQANLIYTITKHTAKYGDQFYYTISTSLPFDVVINEVNTGYDDYQFEGNVPIEYSSYWTINANTLQSNTEFMQYPTILESNAVYYEILGKRYENPSTIVVTYNQKEYEIKIQ